MTLIALASIKGSPGVTTAATAMAASWPAGRKVLLVEADPFGGDLAPRYGVTVTGGLASLFAAARRSLDPEAVWDHVHQLPGGLPVLFGLSGIHQATANERAWPSVTAVLAGLDADVVVDAGRLLPHLAGGIGCVLDQADALVVLCEPRLEAIVHLREALSGLLAVMGDRRLCVLPTGSGDYTPADIGKTLQVDVLSSMPDDPAAAAALGNRSRVKRLERTRLLKWATAAITELGIEPELGTETVPGIEEAPIVGHLANDPATDPAEETATDEPAAEETAEDALATDGEPSVVEPVSAGAESHARPRSPSADEMEPVGAGSNREVGP